MLCILHLSNALEIDICLKLLLQVTVESVYVLASSWARSGVSASRALLISWCVFSFRRFGHEGPFWGREYIFWRDGQPVTLINEIFSPALEEYLGPMHV